MKPSTARKALIVAGAALVAASATIVSIYGSPLVTFLVTLGVAFAMVKVYTSLPTDPITVETSRRNMIIADVRNKAVRERDHQQA